MRGGMRRSTRGVMRGGMFDCCVEDSLLAHRTEENDFVLYINYVCSEQCMEPLNCDCQVCAYCFLSIVDTIGTNISVLIIEVS